MRFAFPDTFKALLDRIDHEAYPSVLVNIIPALQTAMALKASHAITLFTVIPFRGKFVTVIPFKMKFVQVVPPFFVYVMMFFPAAMMLLVS